MLEVVYAIMPIFALIVLGAVLKCNRFGPDGFWRSCEKLTYYILLPALLIEKLSRSSYGSDQITVPVITLVGITLVVGALLVAGRHIFGWQNPAFTSSFQGALRFNSYILLGVAAALYGEAGVGLAALIIAYMIMLLNFLSVIILSVYGTGHLSFLGLGRSLVKNPLLMSALTGFLLQQFQIPLPTVLRDFLVICGDAAMPLSLLTVGAGLIFQLGGKGYLAMAATTLLKLVLFPALVSIGLIWGGVAPGSLAYGVTILFATTPCAINAYILAREMGGDAPLMASMITSTTLFSAVTIPLMMWATGALMG